MILSRTCAQPWRLRSVGIGDPTKASALLPLLADDDPDVVRAAARALGSIHDSAAAAPLAEALTQADQPLLVRRALAAALAAAPHPDAQPALLQALGDPDPQVRGYAAEALGHVGNEDAHDVLAACGRIRRRCSKARWAMSPVAP